MDDQINLNELDRRFPRNEYGCNGVVLISHDLAVEDILDEIGLPAEEREYPCLFVAYDLGDPRDPETMVGVFGCHHFTPLRDETVTTLWFDGELAPVFQESVRYWALDEKGRDEFVFSD